MATQPEALKHNDVEKKEDNALAQEATTYLSKSPALQVVTELLTDLRARAVSWWTPEGLRTRHTASDRMKWLKDRADLRQQITTSLTGLVPKAARKKDPEFQAGLLDAAVDDGDVTAKAFEDAFEPRDLVVYGPAGDYWRQFRQRMPWAQDTSVHQELVATLLRALLTDKSTLGYSRKPILTPWELRTNIPGKVWHTRIPVDVRVAIDEARFEREKSKPKDPFHAKDDLAIALPDIIAANIPLKELVKVFDAAEKAMGFEQAEPSSASGSTGGSNGGPSIRDSVSDAAPAAATSIAPSPATASVAPATTSIAPSTTSAAPGPSPLTASGAPPATAALSFGSMTPAAGTFGSNAPRAATTGKGPPPLRGTFGSSSGFPAAAATGNPPTEPPDSSKTATGHETMPKLAAARAVGDSDAPADDSDMLFDVDLASTDDIAVAPTFEKGEERPTKI